MPADHDQEVFYAAINQIKDAVAAIEILLKIAHCTPEIARIRAELQSLRRSLQDLLEKRPKNILKGNPLPDAQVLAAVAVRVDADLEPFYAGARELKLAVGALETSLKITIPFKINSTAEVARVRAEIQSLQREAVQIGMIGGGGAGAGTAQVIQASMPGGPMAALPSGAWTLNAANMQGRLVAGGGSAWAIAGQAALSGQLQSDDDGGDDGGGGGGSVRPNGTSWQRLRRQFSTRRMAGAYALYAVMRAGEAVDQSESEQATTFGPLAPLVKGSLESAMYSLPVVGGAIHDVTNIGVRAGHSAGFGNGSEGERRADVEQAQFSLGTERLARARVVDEYTGRLETANLKNPFESIENKKNDIKVSATKATSALWETYIAAVEAAGPETGGGFTVHDALVRGRVKEAALDYNQGYATIDEQSHLALRNVDQQASVDRYDLRTRALASDVHIKATGQDSDQFINQTSATLVRVRELEKEIALSPAVLREDTRTAAVAELQAQRADLTRVGSRTYAENFDSGFQSVDSMKMTGGSVEEQQKQTAQLDQAIKLLQTIADSKAIIGD